MAIGQFKPFTSAQIVLDLFTLTEKISTENPKKLANRVGAKNDFD